MNVQVRDHVTGLLQVAVELRCVYDPSPTHATGYQDTCQRRAVRSTMELREGLNTCKRRRRPKLLDGQTTFRDQNNIKKTTLSYSFDMPAAAYQRSLWRCHQLL